MHFMSRTPQKNWEGKMEGKTANCGPGKKVCNIRRTGILVCLKMTGRNSHNYSFAALTIHMA
jgi:hypothetical protein